MACLVVVYGSRSYPYGNSPAVDAVFTMCPEPCSSRPGRNTVRLRTTLIRLMSIDPFPTFERDDLDRADGEHADVVHHEVDPAEALERDVARRLEVADARDVTADRDSLVADLVRHVVRPLRVEIGDDHPRATAGERVRRRTSDATSRHR